MISQGRLDAIVAEFIRKGLDPSTMARRTGVPLPRITATVHRLRGRDPSEANRDTRAKEQQRTRQRVQRERGGAKLT